MCNLKFVGKCHNNLYNSVYSNICKWQESLQLLPMINNEIVKLGINYEKHKGSVIQENQLWEKKFIKLWEKNI